MLRMVSAAIGTVFVQETAEAARTQWRSVADQFRDKLPKLSAMMNDAEHDVLAFMGFPRAHWPQIYSTNPLERLNAEINKISTLPDVKERYAREGVDPVSETPEGFRTYLQAEMTKWAKVVKDTGVRAD